MLLAENSAESTPPAEPSAATVFDVAAAEFEDRVLRASMDKPVIVDFWAPWCGPCKQLGPMLEAAVNSAAGKVLMAKVNLDENQELAAALRIQSVPTVFAFFGGRPVDAFQGVQPEKKIRAFIDKAAALARQAQPDALDIPDALKAAAQALAAGDAGTAHRLYTQILSEDRGNGPAYAGLVRTFIAAGQEAQAAELVENAPENIKNNPGFEEAKTALELAQNAPKGGPEKLARKLSKDPDNLQLRFDLALAEFAAGYREQAIDNLIEIIRRNREWNEEAARKQLLKFFEALGGVDPLTVAGRKKLSSILFS